MIQTDLPDPLAGLSKADLGRLAAAGEQAQRWPRILAKTGDNIVSEVLRHQGPFYEWDHYPKGDAFDRETRSQYYYHAHSKAERPDEHGHFHTFMRAGGMPDGVAPADLPDNPIAPDADGGALAHLIAISMDRAGRPSKLFTTNRWVTGETWYPAEDVVRMLDGFDMETANPSWPANRWLTAMVRLFRPQIERLILARDQAIEAWARDRPGVNVYEDRGLEVAAELEIDVDRQVDRVRDALASA